MRKLLLFTLTTGLLSCDAPPSMRGWAGTSALAWRLAERPAPNGRELVLEAYDPTIDLRIVIRFARELATVGEIVEAELRLPEESGPHRLEILPDRSGVEILGPREVWTDGAMPVRVTFTCRKPGRGGITVRVRE